MRTFDLPPLWLLAFMVAAWWLRDTVPGPDLSGPLIVLPGAVLFAAGGLLMVLGALEMTRAGTTVIPHRDPTEIVTSGIFRLTRNPIYLGDALVLGGWTLLCGAPLLLLLVPVFVWLITVRFILAEEARLRAAFPDAFAAYARQTRRWI